jgi:hypothetical protein
VSKTLALRLAPPPKSAVFAQVWRSPPPKASGKESGSFLKKRTKKLLQIQAEPPRKGRSQLSKRFLLLFFKKADLSFFRYPP